jgi:hypothetical protein
MPETSLFYPEAQNDLALGDERRACRACGLPFGHCAFGRYMSCYGGPWGTDSSESMEAFDEIDFPADSGHQLSEKSNEI